MSNQLNTVATQPSTMSTAISTPTTMTTTVPPCPLPTSFSLPSGASIGGTVTIDLSTEPLLSSLKFRNQDEFNNFALGFQRYVGPSWTITTQHISGPTIVSWQSAYWGVLALAANTFLQEPGTLPGLDGCPGRLLRLSPWTCALDSVYIILCYIVGFCAGYGPRKVAGAVLKARGLEPHKSSIGQEARPVEETRVAGAITLMLALTQLVKLTAMRGIMLTQASAWAYFSSYALVEGTRWLAYDMPLGSAVPQDAASGNAGESDQPELPQIVDSRAMRWVWGMLMHHSLWLTQSLVVVAVNELVELARPGSSMARLEGSLASKWGFSMLNTPGFMAIRFVAIPVDPATVLGGWHPQNRVVVASCAVFAVYAVVAACMLAGVLDVPGLLGLVAGVCVTGPVAWGTAAVGDWMCEAEGMRVVREWTGLETREQWLSWGFGVVFLVLGLLSYAFCWREEGTFKPSWTEKLG